MAVNHTWNPFTDLSGTPSHSAAIRDKLLPTIQGRLEVQPYATTAALPAAGDFVGQQAYTTDYGVMWWWTGAAWRRAHSESMRTPVEVLLAADYPVTATSAVIMTSTIDVPGADAVYKITVNADVGIVSATAATLTIGLSVSGAAQPGSIVLITNTSLSGVRLHKSHTWLVSGLAAGSKAFNIAAAASAASRFTLIYYANTKMLIEQVA